MFAVFPARSTEALRMFFYFVFAQKGAVGPVFPPTGSGFIKEYYLISSTAQCQQMSNQPILEATYF